MSDDKGRRIAGGVGHRKTTRCLDAFRRLFEHKWLDERRRIMCTKLLLEEVNWDSANFLFRISLHHDAMIDRHPAAGFLTELPNRMDRRNQKGLC
jgi:hypothetical protein